MTLKEAFRVACRALLLAPIWIGHYLVYMTAGVLPLLSARRRALVRDAMVRGWAGWTARVVGLSVEVTGPVPNAPFFLVSNHLSYLDIIVFLSRVRGYFVAKREVSGWPILGHFAQVAGTLFVERTRARDATRVNALITDTLAAGNGIILFPEGTSTDGTTLGSFKPALLNPAAIAEIPVHCAALRYTIDDPDLDPREVVCWWGDMTFGPHFVRLLSVPRVRAHLTFSGDPVRSSDRKELAAVLHDRVSALIFGEGRSVESSAPEEQGRPR